MNYRKSQFERLQKENQYPAKLKISTEVGDMKWIDITDNELRDIIALLGETCAHCEENLYTIIRAHAHSENNEDATV